ncbi:MAG: site-2 protease family protein [Planctomycetota bacterium]
MHLDLPQLVVSLVIIILSGVLHEYMHGYVAYKLGDPTAYLEGRLTLNPIAHLSLFSSVIFPVTLFILSQGRFIFGGAKPVPINPYYFKNPSKDLMLSAAAGPLTNIVIAIVFAFIYGLVSHKLADNTLDRYILFYIIVINMILGAFNLIPIPPLDGSRILRYFLPQKGKEILDSIEPFGLFIIIMLFATGFLDIFLRPLFYIINELVTISGGIASRIVPFE